MFHILFHIFSLVRDIWLKTTIEGDARTIKSEIEAKNISNSMKIETDV